MWKEMLKLAEYPAQVTIPSSGNVCPHIEDQLWANKNCSIALYYKNTKTKL